VSKKAPSKPTTSGVERTSLGVAVERRLASAAKGTKLGAVINAVNTAIIEEISALYLGGVLIDADWFANNARIKRVDGVITVWPFGGSIGWPPEPAERWTIADAGAKPADTERPPVQEIIRQFAINEFGSDWERIPTPAIEKAAKKNEDFKRRVPTFPSRTTFDRALGRKAD
jgi:hypothetical protein